MNSESRFKLGQKVRCTRRGWPFHYGDIARVVRIFEERGPGESPWSTFQFDRGRLTTTQDDFEPVEEP